MATVSILGAVLLVAGAAAVVVVLLFRRRKSGGTPTFEGTVTFGWEVSAFVPGAPSNKSPRYWVAWTADSGFLERFRAQGFDPSWSPGYGSVRTKFEGTLETGATAGYGHMGQYAGQITVHRVISMSPAEPRE